MRFASFRFRKESSDNESTDESIGSDINASPSLLENGDLNVLLPPELFETKINIIDKKMDEVLRELNDFTENENPFVSFSTVLVC